MTRAAVERRLINAERLASRRAPPPVPPWLQDALSAASADALLRLERVAEQWPDGVTVPTHMVVEILPRPPVLRLALRGRGRIRIGS